MAGTNPYEARQCDFNYTRQDDKPIVFVKRDASGNPLDNTGYSYQMEGNPVPDPTDETNHIFQFVGVAGGADGRITFTPVGGAGGDFDPTGIDVIFYDMVEIAPGQSTGWAAVRGEITLDPRITDKGL